MWQGTGGPGQKDSAKQMPLTSEGTRGMCPLIKRVTEECGNPWRTVFRAWSKGGAHLLTLLRGVRACSRAREGDQSGRGRPLCFQEAPGVPAGPRAGGRECKPREGFRESARRSGGLSAAPQTGRLPPHTVRPPEFWRLQSKACAQGWSLLGEPRTACPWHPPGRGRLQLPCAPAVWKAPAHLCTRCA